MKDSEINSEGQKLKDVLLSKESFNQKTGIYPYKINIKMLLIF